MPTLKRQIKDLGKHGLRKLFEVGQRFGIDVLPRHFYSEIPDVSELRDWNGWKNPRSMVGISGIGIPDQLRFVASCCPASLVDRTKRGAIHAHGCLENAEPGFGVIEADFLYCFIATKKPRRIVQIGCGVSTSVILLAAHEAGYTPELICVEPFPNAFLTAADRAGLIELVPKKAQHVPLEMLTDLGANDMLFVDSSHAVRPGSEVNLVILEVLPRLIANTWVHFHDIYFPYDYQRGLLTGDLFFSSESVLLHAFLTGNPRYTIRASLSMLHYACPDQLGRYLPNYSPAKNEHGLEGSEGHFPASTFLQVLS